MSSHDFWHEDMFLLHAYEKAYYNHIHSLAYVQASYNSIAFEIGYRNGWCKTSNEKIAFDKIVKLRDVITETIEKEKAETEKRKKELWQEQVSYWI